ncbi:MAG: hypothetical protein R3Y26_08570 [Rikenellaceae bacterium]
MNKNYEAPQIEVIEIEIEGVLCASGIEATSYGSSLSNRRQ